MDDKEFILKNLAVYGIKCYRSLNFLFFSRSDTYKHNPISKYDKYGLIKQTQNTQKINNFTCIFENKHALCIFKNYEGI